MRSTLTEAKPARRARRMASSAVAPSCEWPMRWRTSSASDWAPMEIMVTPARRSRSSPASSISEGCSSTQTSSMVRRRRPGGRGSARARPGPRWACRRPRRASRTGTRRARGPTGRFPPDRPLVAPVPLLLVLEAVVRAEGAEVPAEGDVEVEAGPLERGGPGHLARGEAHPSPLAGDRPVEQWLPESPAEMPGPLPAAEYNRAGRADAAPRAALLAVDDAAYLPRVVGPLLADPRVELAAAILLPLAFARAMHPGGARGPGAVAARVRLYGAGAFLGLAARQVLARVRRGAALDDAGRPGARPRRPAGALRRLGERPGPGRAARRLGRPGGAGGVQRAGRAGAPLRRAGRPAPRSTTPAPLRRPRARLLDAARGAGGRRGDLLPCQRGAGPRRGGGERAVPARRRPVAPPGARPAQRRGRGRGGGGGVPGRGGALPPQAGPAEPPRGWPDAAAVARYRAGGGRFA